MDALSEVTGGLHRYLKATNECHNFFFSKCARHCPDVWFGSIHSGV